MASKETCLTGFYHGSKELELKQHPIPSLEGLLPGTVLVKGLFASICGSDLLCVNHRREIDHCPGGSIHEVVGEIIDIVDDETDPDARQKYVGKVALALPTNYMTSGIFRDVPKEFAQKLRDLPLTGGLAQYFLGHTSHLYLIPENTTIPHEHYTAAQPIGTLLWMLRQAPSLIHKNVLVLGVGPNGLLLTHLIANLCAKTVIAVDIVDERLEVAKQMKATHCFNAKDYEECLDQVREVTGGEGVDVVFEMVGHQPDTLNHAFDYVKREGTVIGFGVPNEPSYKVQYAKIFRKNLTVIGSVFPRAHEDFPLGMDLIAQGRINVAPVFSHTLPISQAVNAFDACLHRKNEVCKVLLDLQKIEE